MTTYHLVWATKNREHLIQPEIEGQLYAYIVGKAAELGVYVYAINGWHDHMHVVVSIPPKHAVAYVVKRLKGASAHDVNQAGRVDYHFGWQRGYGALSLGEHQTHGWNDIPNSMRGQTTRASRQARSRPSYTNQGLYTRVGANCRSERPRQIGRE